MGSSARTISVRAVGALVAALAAGALAACAHSGPVCRPVFSWAAPAHGCAARLHGASKAVSAHSGDGQGYKGRLA